ncbi:MAG TPA: ROK family protein [Tepidisphaeraceae bacterium]
MPTIVAIDIGGTTVKLALVRADADPTTPHEILIRDKIDTLAQEPGQRIVARIAEGVNRMIRQTGERPVGAGAGCPGLIDNRRGVVVVSANLPTFREFPLAAELEKQLGLPTAIHNDAKAAMLGEYEFGANRGCANMVLLTLGTGVGGGVITGGRLVTGAENAATELGHVKVEYTDPAPCGCGTHGCLEAYVGMGGIRRIALAILAKNPSPMIDQANLSTKTFSDAARAGDPTARQVLITVGEYLGRGIAHFIDIFNPDRVILAGGVSRATDLLMPGIRPALEQYCSFPSTRDRAQVVATSFPDDINVLGAAAVFLNSQK